MMILDIYLEIMQPYDEERSLMERRIAAYKIKKARIMIQILTGFSVDRIENRRHELLEIYKTSPVRPFPVLK